jgi:hypothetical protein
VTRATGGCMCGAVRYECTTDPIYMFNCHCRDCQRSTGTAYTPVIALARSGVKIIGDPKYHAASAESGNRLERGFCPNCGSLLFALPSAAPDRIAIAAASLDDPSIFKPAMDIYTASAQAWDHMNPGLPKFPKMPPTG